MDKTKMISAAMRLVEVRKSLLASHPFFGRLLMHLPFGFADCGTACTDMRRIIFDPEFADKLSREELIFVVLHELMHCVLRHCARGGGRNREIYNIACDKVINSIIFEAMGVEEFDVAGMPAMHRAPNGEEARKYTTEEVYNMMMEKLRTMLSAPAEEGWRDSHEVWSRAENDEQAKAIWSILIRDAMKKAGKCNGVANIPAGLRRHLPETSYSGKIAWEQVLHDFLRFDRGDFVFERPDRRYGGDIAMPSFCEEVYGTRIEKIWFVTDTSGSMSEELLAAVFEELKNAVEQIDTVRGELSFFDCEVTDPKEFSDVGELMKIKPVGGGGTSFDVIFSFMKEHFEEKPRAVIIMTDGFASFPDEDAAGGVPVIWVIADSGVEPPWGECIHINTV